MACWLKLTHIHGKDPVYVNMDLCSSFYSVHDMESDTAETILHFANHTDIRVLESLDEVREQLRTLTTGEIW